MRKSAQLVKFTLCIALAAVAGASVSAGQAPPSAAATLAAKLIKQYSMSDTQFSPDGSRAVFVVREPAVGKEVRSNIWLYDDASSMARRFTSAGSDDSSPRWSPDGAELAFLSARDDGPAQIYLIRTDGGEARAVTKVEGGVRSFEWSPAGGRIAFLSADPAPKPADPANDAQIASQTHRPARLMILDTASGEIRKAVRDDKWAVGQFAWLPDGKGLVITAGDDFLPERALNRVFILSLGNGELREVARIDSVEFGGLQVSPGGDLLAYVGSSSGPTTHDLFVLPLDGREVRNLTGAGSMANVDRPVDHVSWISSDELVFVTADGLGSTIRSVDTRGRASVLERFPAHTVRALDAAGARLLYEKSSATTPAEMWLSGEGDGRRVTSLHSGFPQLIAPEIIRYPGEDGFEIEAAVYYPRERHGPAPMVALIHGGPTGRFSHSVTNWAQMLAASGYVVLAPNIRGSTGYGEAFMKANRAAWGEGDFRDVMAGVDYLIEKGVADSERLAIAGWSYGGYMSAWATTQTRRFKAAVVGAAMLDLNVQWGAELPEIVAYDTWYLGTPWEQPENFRRMSPISHVENVVTPTLLLVGEEDAVDHPVQNWQYFRALRMRGVPAELIVYPREGHSIREEAHARDVLVRVVEWVDRRLKRTPRMPT